MLASRQHKCRVILFGHDQIGNHIIVYETVCDCVMKISSILTTVADAAVAPAATATATNASDY